MLQSEDAPLPRLDFATSAFGCSIDLSPNWREGMCINAALSNQLDDSCYLFNTVPRSAPNHYSAKLGRC